MGMTTQTLIMSNLGALSVAGSQPGHLIGHGDLIAHLGQERDGSMSDFTIEQPTTKSRSRAMTTNTERATEVIKEAFDVAMSSDTRSTWAYQIAQALTDAGRLIPELPEPHIVNRYPGSVCWEVCTDPSAAARRHIGVRVDHMHKIKTNITGEVTPDEAREAAFALLAAANHAEKAETP